MDNKFLTYDNNLMSVNEFRKRLCNSAVNSLINDITFKIKSYELYRARWSISEFMFNVEKLAKASNKKYDWKLKAIGNNDGWEVMIDETK